MRPFRPAIAIAAAAALPAAALTIDFDVLPPGTVLGSQYAAFGVVFVPNAFTGPGSSSSGEPWATNTDLTVVSLDSGTLGIDYGALGGPPLVSGNIVRRYAHWPLEDGDPSFAIHLATPAASVSVTFAGIGGAALAPDVRLFAFAGSVPVGSAAGALPGFGVGQLTLEVSGGGITRVAVAPGGYYDWVAFDRVVVTPVGEPATAALLAAGAAMLALLGARRRRA
jgi:hypothetical protein